MVTKGMIQCTGSPCAMEFSVLFHFEKTNSLTQIRCFQRPTHMTSLEWPLWKLFFQITDYMNLVTNFKRHSNRLKLTCSWNLVHLLPYMQLATFFLLRTARQLKTLCWCSSLEHRLGNDNVYELKPYSRYSHCEVSFCSFKEWNLLQ